MINKHFGIIASELNIGSRQVEATVELLDEGGTVPFISRYRKEVTGSLDEVQITAIRDRVQQLRDLDKRKEAIIKSLKETQNWSEELEQKVMEAETMTLLEDIYLPYKPKRRTKATIAKEKGLEPLAKWIFEQEKAKGLEEFAQTFVDDEKQVANVEEALQGARDIMAEWMNENAELRSKMRDLFIETGVVSSKVIKGKEEEGIKFKDYFEWEESVKDVPSHRLLAMRRGEKEGFLMMDMGPDEEEAVAILNRQFVKGDNEVAEQVKLSARDAYKRLLKPSMETEVRLYSKKKADEEAIKVFASNVKELLMAAPLGGKNIMGIDPGFRTGCKVVCLDAQGKLLHFEAIYPNEPQRKIAESGAIIKHLVDKFKVEAIAVGNGTASRETESFVKSLQLPKDILLVMVSESGASIYSASDVAREEFPDQDLTVRGAVSIGRRLMDPLAELVKIDPKSIGVGQYQHDVDQNALKTSLDDVVMSCVNAVGVEVNTASKQLLAYVSGLGPSLAQNIIEFRNQNGPFKDREALKRVPRLGDKAFEQAAAFLRIREASHPLDNSAVHPESYHIVEQMAKDLGCTIQDLIKDGSLRQKIQLNKYVTDKVGLPTLQDIVEELAKPGRDPREAFEAFSFTEGVNEISDLRVGMKLPGLVTNVTNFGAFVDIGVHQDGLVHISHLSDSFVSDPAKVLSVQQKVMVTVMEVDIPRKRISLSMKSDPFASPAPREKASTERKGPAPRRQFQNQQEQAPEGDLQAKLAMLKGKFKN